MELVSLNCKNCNAVLSVDPAIAHAYCQFCGSVFLIDYGNNVNSAAPSGNSQQDFEIKAGTLIRYNGNNISPVIPYNVRSIGNKAFSGIDIVGVTIPSSVVKIGQYAFMDCTCLTSVIIPTSVQKIDNRAFWRCFNLSDVVLAESTILGDEVFLGTPFWDKLLTEYRKQQAQKQVEYRVRNGLCPNCGGRYNLFDRCKICGRKRA